MKASTIGERWIDSCRQTGGAYLITDSLLGTRLKPASALAGSIILARRIDAISKERNVGAFLPTSAGAMLMNMAVMLLGKTLINLNFTAGRAAVASAIEQAGIKTVYTSTRFLSRLRERGIETDWLGEIVNLVMLEDCRESVTLPEKLRTIALVRLAPAFVLKRLYLRPQEPEQPAVILFSSGSEGEPKGVLLSHRNILTNIDQVLDVIDLEPDDVLLANLPIFHAFGLTATVFLPLLNRLPVVTHPDPAEVTAAAQVIVRYKVTLLFGTSSFFRLYVRNHKVSPDMLASLRLLVAGAEKLQPEVRDAFSEKFGKELLEGYGATETAPVVSVNLPNEDGRIRHKPGSVGRPIAGTRLRIVDPQTHETLPGKSPGMILVNGGQVMQGYLNEPRKTREALIDLEGETWYVTGDKGYVDEDGFLYIEDRYSRFAKIGGEMISLAGIESAIRRTSGDIDLDLVAVNLSNPKKGEAIVILSNQDLDAALMRKRLRDAGYSALAMPAAFHRVEAVPKLGSGKTDFASARTLADHLEQQRRASNQKEPKVST